MENWKQDSSRFGPCYQLSVIRQRIAGKHALTRVVGIGSSTLVQLVISSEM